MQSTGSSVPTWPLPAADSGSKGGGTAVRKPFSSQKASCNKEWWAAAAVPKHCHVWGAADTSFYTESSFKSSPASSQEGARTQHCLLLCLSSSAARRSRGTRTALLSCTAPNTPLPSLDLGCSEATIPGGSQHTPNIILRDVGFYGLYWW